MGDCHTAIQKVTFDFSDEQVTKVRVESKSWGDCGILAKSVVEKSFPASIPAIEIMQMEGGLPDYLLWDVPEEERRKEQERIVKVLWEGGIPVRLYEERFVQGANQETVE